MSGGMMLQRVIVDENAGPGTAVWEQFQRALGSQPYEYLFLATEHPGIPDVEILDKLLRPDDILLTADRVLHMRVLARRCVSYSLNERGQLTRKPLEQVRVTKPLPVSAHSSLLDDYHHRPATDFARRMKAGFTERQFKRYRTARRRIRSHFGSAAGLDQLSVTIGSTRTPSGLVCGFVFNVAGCSGVKGLRASEGYCLARGPEADPAWPALHALRDQYLLQLEHLRTDLFVIPPSSLELMQQLVARDEPASPPSHEALRRLMRALPTLTLHLCVKGWFHDAMQAKLQQLVRSRGNEVTALDFDSLAANVLADELDPGA